ncbi:MerR family transcriptional regulator [Nocardia wallacei]|uniref:MerR family transcriptional regulator n=1 Tax=Nocardia wallacei TaxID=480035 RepID=UPI00245573DE|nr:MerR family transcriptional regulator [Nocardia wallacei]
MRIGELARRTGATRRALRYYEEQGLLPDRRSPNGYREYDEHAVRLVDDIRRLLSVGFTAEEVTGSSPACTPILRSRNSVRREPRPSPANSPPSNPPSTASPSPATASPNCWTLPIGLVVNAYRTG